MDKVDSRAMKAEIIARCPGVSDAAVDAAAMEVKLLAAGDPAAARDHLERAIAALSAEDEIGDLEIFYQDEMWDD